MPMFNTILESDEASRLFDDIAVSEYWQTHYVPDKLSKHKSKSLGSEFKDILIINVLAPLLYTYGRFSGQEKYVDRAFDLLYKTAHEANSKTRIFEQAGWQQRHAFDTQAMLELHEHYCTRKRCLECSIGHKILRSNNVEVLSNNF